MIMAVCSSIHMCVAQKPDFTHDSFLITIMNTQSTIQALQQLSSCTCVVGELMIINSVQPGGVPGVPLILLRFSLENASTAVPE